MIIGREFLATRLARFLTRDMITFGCRSSAIHFVLRHFSLPRFVQVPRSVGQIRSDLGLI
jgi:hypothetical protein